MSDTKSGQAKAFFEQASIYLANRPSIRLRSEIMRDLLGKRSNDRMLDIGCGDGSLSISYIAENNICFLDFSSAMLEHVKESIPEEFRDHATLLQANVEDHIFAEKFDIILCVGVLAHVRDVDKIMAKIESILKPSGLAIFQVSNTDHFYYRLRSLVQSEKKDQYGYSLNTIHPDMLIEKAKGLGLKCLKRFQYPVVFPLLGLFGTRFTFFFLKTVYKSRIFRFLASEHVMLFQKTTS